MSKIWKMLVAVIFAAASLKAQTPDAASIRGQVTERPGSKTVGLYVHFGDKRESGRYRFAGTTRGVVLGPRAARGENILSFFRRI